MKPRTLVHRSLTWYWRTNAAVVLGVATAVAVLSGALLVGDSVRGSLRDLVIQRLGAADFAVVSAGFFREQLSADIQAQPSFSADFDGIAPLVITEGVVGLQTGGGRASNVLIYGVDDRFWNFHGLEQRGPEERGAFVSPSLASELGVSPDDTIVVRLQRPSSIPLESLFSFKEDVARVIRARVESVLPADALGEFSLRAQQGSMRSVFVPIKLLQAELNTTGRVNALLVSSRGRSAGDLKPALENLVQLQTQLEDYGLRVRILKSGSIALEADSGLIEDRIVEAAETTARLTALRPQRVLTYLANGLSTGTRSIPYSLVTAIDLPVLEPSDPPQIVLNNWAARDLGAVKGTVLSMEYYTWVEPGRLETRTQEFRIAGEVPISAGDSDLAPIYPGITDSASLSDWDPPFPIDLKRIRPIDEEYWDRYGTTPKAYIALEAGQKLWGSRYGSVTSVRFVPTGPTSRSPDEITADFSRLLLVNVSPLGSGLSTQAVLSESLDASRGATDFGEYFVYFSFFIVISALLLAVLFFKLSVEQRIREVGLLRAVGISKGLVGRLFLTEGLFLSLCGAVIGIPGGIAYASLILLALRTWWVDAVGTTALGLHVSPASLAIGAAGGVAAAAACIAITLRSLRRVSERSLLAGELSTAQNLPTGHHRLRPLVAAFGFAALGLLLAGAGWAGEIHQAGGFFGAGAALLCASLCLAAHVLTRSGSAGIQGPGWRSISRLGFRNAGFRPSRSVVAMAAIGAAVFILIAVDAFRKDAGDVANSAGSGLGGYSLLVQTLAPVAYDPNSPEGRQRLGLDGADRIRIEPFRVRPGDDASCLNLYEPKNPRIMAPSADFIEAGRFAFSGSLAVSDGERVNPWLLLRRTERDGAVPVIADGNSMTYVLHRKLGEDIVIVNAGREIRLRLVGALQDSIFQGELLMSPENFQQLFPEQEGYEALLVETPPDQAAAVATNIESALEDLGADAMLTSERLAQFHRVESTYLSTFQMLGALGLLLGTIGLAAVILRNVLERRRELALLRALGYRNVHFLAMAAAENGLILIWGLMSGVFCAAVAVTPVLLERGGRLPGPFLLFLVGVVLAAGLITSLTATSAALRAALLTELRSE